MAEQPIATEDSTAEEDDELESERREDHDEAPEDEAPEDEAPDDAAGAGDATEPNAARWAIRGALVGAVAGAGVGVLVGRRPEALKHAKGVVGGHGKQIATAAALAAAEVMTWKRLSQLLAGDGNGDRAQVVKETAKEAGAAAASAARDAIVSVRREAIGSE